MRERLYDHILGSLVTAAIGDAMGAATEQRSTREIVADFGGLVRSFYKPPMDTFAAGNEAGEVTDDASQMFALARVIIETDGHLSGQAWVDALVHWAETSKMARMMGPTTRPTVEALRAGEDPRKVGVIAGSDRQTSRVGTSNGAAMRIAPVGLIHPGDPAGACQDALITCLPTHNTQIAIAGACAIAAGVAEAVTEGADVFLVVKACLEGARRGEELGAREGRFVAGPSVAARIEWAVSLALRANTLEEAMSSLEAYIGNSVYAADSVPTAIGLFVFAEGDPLQSIVGGTNIGNDTDTIAAMAGSLAGALKGFRQVPQGLYDALKKANDADIEALAHGLTEIAVRRIA